MLDATLEGFQFLVTFLYVSRHFLGGGMRWNLGWKCRSFQQATSCNCCTYYEKKNKWSLYKRCMPVPLQQRNHRKVASLPLPWALPFPTLPPFLPWLREWQKPINLPTKQASSSSEMPCAMANAIDVEVVDGANHLLHHLSRERKILEESGPREVHNLDE